jgi:hypothetical protein
LNREPVLALDAEEPAASCILHPQNAVDSWLPVSTMGYGGVMVQNSEGCMAVIVIGRRRKEERRLVAASFFIDPSGKAVPLAR